MRRLASMLLVGIAGCAVAQPPEPTPRVLRDRRPEVPSRTMVFTPANRNVAPIPRHAAPTTQPTTSPTGDVFPGSTVGPLAQPIPPTDPSRFAPRPDDDWQRHAPTDPSSTFDRRFDRRNQLDDLNRMDPRLADPPASTWERDFDPDRK